MCHYDVNIFNNYMHAQAVVSCEKPGYEASAPLRSASDDLHGH